MSSSRSEGPGQFARRTALVTGAGSGIGAAIAARLAREGASVAVLDRDGAAAATVADAIARAGGEAAAFTCDVADPAAVGETVDEIARRWDGVQILVNNAGVVVPGAADTLSIEDWNSNLSVNLSGTFHCCRAVLPYMLERGVGAIVSISSLSAFHPIQDRAGYAAAKGGVFSLTRSLALDYAPRGIRVNAVAPGPIETALNREHLRRPEVRSGVVAGIPLARIGRPEDVASVVCFLASDEAAFVTGQTVFVDGGASIP